MKELQENHLRLQRK